MDPAEVEIPAIEEELGIEIIKTEMFATFRQTIALKNKEKIPEAITYLQAKLTEGGATGKLYVNMTQGGTQNVTTEEIGRIPLGSELEEAVDAVFGR